MKGAIRPLIHVPSRERKAKHFMPRYILTGHQACRQEPPTAEDQLRRQLLQGTSAGTDNGHDKTGQPGTVTTNTRANTNSTAGQSTVTNRRSSETVSPKTFFRFTIRPEALNLPGQPDSSLQAAAHLPAEALKEHRRKLR